MSQIIRAEADRELESYPHDKNTPRTITIPRTFITYNQATIEGCRFVESIAAASSADPKSITTYRLDAGDNINAKARCQTTNTYPCLWVGKIGLDYKGLPMRHRKHSCDVTVDECLQSPLGVISIVSCPVCSLSKGHLKGC